MISKLTDVEREFEIGTARRICEWGETFDGFWGVGMVMGTGMRGVTFIAMTIPAGTTP